MSYRSKISAIMAVAAMWGAISVAGAAQKWDMPVRSNLQNFMTQNISQFADEVREKTKGELDIVLHPEDSLLRQPDVKPAIQRAQVPIGEFFMSMYSNENSLFGVDSIPFLTRGFSQNADLLKHVRPELEKLLSKQRMKLLFVAPWPPQSFYSKHPINSLKDFSGVRFRAYNPITARMAELMGASPVTVQQAEVSQAFSTGVIDAMITSPATGVDTQAWDFVKYFTDVRAFIPWNLVAVNQRAFDRLDEETRKVILDAAKAAEERAWKNAPAETGKLIDILSEHGMEVIKPSDTLMNELTKVGQTLLQEWKDDSSDETRKVVEEFIEERDAD